MIQWHYIIVTIPISDVVPEWELGVEGLSAPTATD